MPLADFDVPLFAGVILKVTSIANSVNCQTVMSEVPSAALGHMPLAVGVYTRISMELKRMNLINRQYDNDNEGQLCLDRESAQPLLKVLAMNIL